MNSSSRRPLRLAYLTPSPQLDFATARLDKAFGELGVISEYSQTFSAQKLPDIVLATQGAGSKVLEQIETLEKVSSIAPEAFRIIKQKGTLFVLGGDDTGAMYGVLDLVEQLRARGSLEEIQEKEEKPHLPFRAVKFDLPWSSYRMGDALTLHTETCRDRSFWSAFLDQMAENRFNALTLWNLHPFTYMFRPKNFPEACGLSDEELADWQGFWRFLFRYAKNRGIESYVVNWNIFVSPEFAERYDVAFEGAEYHFGDGNTSDIVKRYNRDCVSQLMEEYEDLTGFGTSLGERMHQMSSREAADWIDDVVIPGIKQASRPVKFIYRAPFIVDPSGGKPELRRILDKAKLPGPVWVEYKFNWSHGHSTPTLAMTHDISSKSPKIDDRYWNPTPENYKMVWMVRNEDFFILRWGEPDFIREHITTNSKDYVGGYIVGSEGYIPAKDYSHVPEHPHFTWRYAFEKQWLFYTLWGRLLYNPRTANEIFEAAFDRRYGKGSGEAMLQAYTLASRMPLRLASFHAATWDYTLYAEGFLAPFPSLGLNDELSPFISIDEFINHKTLEPSYLAIPEYVEQILQEKPFSEGVTTPLMLAEACEADGYTVLDLAERLQSSSHARPAAFESELEDLRTWAYLSLYLAAKLRGGVALETFRRTGEREEREKSVRYLEHAVSHWEAVIDHTETRYQSVPYIDRPRTGFKLDFAWHHYREEVKRDVEIARTVNAAT